ncbi:MAG: DUF3326 domain-containing protein, partial [Phormidesmis sp.]
AERLINEAGVRAIAVVVRFPDNEDSAALAAYRQGKGVDPLAGVEAVISHLVVRTFKLPCAHAPALSPLPLDTRLSPRSAAEEIGYTFLPCILAGLSRAPQFVNQPDQPSTAMADPAIITAHQVDAVVVPATAFGGSAVMSLAPQLTQRGAQVIAVGENSTTMAVRAADLGIRAIAADTYLEAVGIIAAYRAGVMPNALQPHVQSLRVLK